MANLEAIQLAVHMHQHPALIRQVRSRRLPRGLTELLEVVSGNDEVAAAASTALGVSQDRLLHATTFFVEQVLFHHRASSYRILGVESDAPTSLVRRHMVMLMKWAHPDAVTLIDRGQVNDRLAKRVTTAWEDLKSNQRRTTYDTRIASSSVQHTNSSNRRTSGAATPAKAKRLSMLDRIASLWR